MSFIDMDTIVAAFVIINVILLAVSLKLGRSQSTPSLDDLMRKVAENAGKTNDNA